jgi:tetratricopeptide (TPR) repeat protein
MPAGDDRRGGRSGAQRSSGPRRDDREGGNRKGGSRGRSERSTADRYGPGSRYRGDKSRQRTDRDEKRAPRPVGPEIPEGVSGRDLDKAVYRQLSGLPLKVVDRVAAHLVMAGNLADEDPDTAYAHAKAARAEAARVAVVREAVGETAYASGRFGEALAELRAAKRLNGSWDYLPIMADCERALKRPERAIALSQESGVANLEQAGQVEMTIVAAGARRDMGQLEAAIQLLETAPLHSRSRQPWVARLRYAYADALVEAGRTEDAITWFHRTVSVDSFAATDATERAAELEKATGQV